MGTRGGGGISQNVSRDNKQREQAKQRRKVIMCSNGWKKPAIILSISTLGNEFQIFNENFVWWPIYVAKSFWNYWTLLTCMSCSFCKLSIGYKASFVIICNILAVQCNVQLQWCFSYSYEIKIVLTHACCSAAVSFLKCMYCLIIFRLFLNSWYVMKFKCSTHIDVSLCQHTLHSIQDELVWIVYRDFVSSRRYFCKKVEGQT